MSRYTPKRRRELQIINPNVGAARRVVGERVPYATVADKLPGVKEALSYRPIKPVDDDTVKRAIHLVDYAMVTPDGVRLCDQLDDWADEDHRARHPDAKPGVRPGRPPTVTWRALLVAMRIVGEEEFPDLAVEIAKTVWFRIPQHFHEGLGIAPVGWGCTVLGCIGERCVHIIERLATRVRYQLRTLTRLMDPYGDHVGRRLTPEQAADARRTYQPGEQERLAERLSVTANAILGATRAVTPQGMMDGWNGEYTLDGTRLRSWARSPRYTHRADRAPGENPMIVTSADPSAGWDKDQNWGHEVVLVAMAASDTDDGILYRPALVQGMSIFTRPGTDLAARTVQALDNLAARGLPPTRIVNDRGFTMLSADSYQTPLTARYGTEFVHDYPRNLLGPRAYSRGAVFIEASLYCADLPPHLAYASVHFFIGDEHGNRITVDEYRARLAARSEHRFKPKDLKRNRWRCPASGRHCTARCSNRPETLTISNAAKPRVYPTVNTGQPGTDGLVVLPDACTRGDITINPDDDAELVEMLLRYGQAREWMTPSWSAAYQQPRSTIEGFNGFVKDEAKEALASAGRRRMHGGAIGSIFAAFRVLAANIRKIVGFLNSGLCIRKPNGEVAIVRLSKADREALTANSAPIDQDRYQPGPDPPGPAGPGP